MTISHHPSDGTLAAFATGALNEGQRLVVATHVAACPACRQAARAFECIGGAELERTAPVPMQPGAFADLQKRLDSEKATARAAAPEPVHDLLSSYRTGEWRWIGPGVSYRSVDIPVENGARVFMLKAAPGTQLPHHAHSGSEWTCILQGAFRHAGGRFGPGDFDEADGSIEHVPVIEDGEECICLVALEGNVVFKSLLGRLIQPFVRM